MERPQAIQSVAHCKHRLKTGQCCCVYPVGWRMVHSEDGVISKDLGMASVRSLSITPSMPVVT